MWLSVIFRSAWVVTFYFFIAPLYLAYDLYLYCTATRKAQGGIPVKGRIRKVCVIGGGASGITAAKALLEEGDRFEVTVFEATDCIGGNWVYRKEESHASIYRSTYINSSKMMTAFSDYPMPECFPIYPHHTHISKYFKDYANHFGVVPCIRFNTRVVDVTLESKEEKDAWHVTVEGPNESGKITRETFIYDAVFIASGHHWNPITPQFKGLEKFKGQILHSHAYKIPEPFADTRIVVVGFGNSAMDIACETSRIAKHVYVSARTHNHVLPKLHNGQPVDWIGNSRALHLVPFFIRRWILELLLNFSNGHMSQFGIKPAAPLQHQHPTLSDNFLSLVAHGCITLKPNILELKEHEVVFEDGSSVPADVVVFSTGYKIEFPFLAKDIVDVVDNRIDLYKNVIHPNYPTLAFIGLVQPLGAIMPIAEMQCRWVVRYLMGLVNLPSAKDMLNDAELRFSNMRKRFTARVRHTIQVDYVQYMDELASMIGVRPLMWKRPFMFYELFFGGVTPTHYRLDGPHKWANAEAEIMKANKQATIMNATDEFERLA